MQLSDLLALLDTKGGEYALNTRNRLRTAYVAAKTYGKNHNWTPSDDKAFDNIDEQTVALVKDAGMLAPQPPALPTLLNASEDDFRREAAARGFALSPAAKRPPAPALGTAPSPFLPGEKEPQAPATAPVLKPPGFA